MRASRWKVWLAVAGLVALLVGCGEMRPAGSPIVIYTVKPGDTLYSIAWEYGYDYREVAAWNRIDSPYVISIGQQLAIIPPFLHTPRPRPSPPPAARTSPPTSAGGATPSATPTPVVSAPARLNVPTETASASAPKPTPVAPVPSAPVVRAGPAPVPAVPVPAPAEKTPPPTQGQKAKTVAAAIHWRWPTDGGRVVSRFSAKNAKKGIDIDGKLGEPVKAAADGQVVYSGDGLIGYGNLVIVKHDDLFLSAYGYNRRLLVKEGDRVQSGQKIAEIGQSGKSGSILHFQIRREGKPVDPLHYLPDR